MARAQRAVLAAALIFLIGCAHAAEASSSRGLLADQRASLRNSKEAKSSQASTKAAKRQQGLILLAILAKAAMQAQAAQESQASGTNGTAADASSASFGGEGLGTGLRATSVPPLRLRLSALASLLFCVSILHCFWVAALRTRHRASLPRHPCGPRPHTDGPQTPFPSRTPAPSSLHLPALPGQGTHGQRVAAGRGRGHIRRRHQPAGGQACHGHRFRGRRRRQAAPDPQALGRAAAAAFPAAGFSRYVPKLMAVTLSLAGASHRSPQTVSSCPLPRALRPSARPSTLAAPTLPHSGPGHGPRRRL